MHFGWYSNCEKHGPTNSRQIFLLFDRDAKFGAEVLSAVRDMGSEPTRTAFRSPWQNGVAERWVGSCRRDLLDHVIILNGRATNQPAIQIRRAYVKWKEILLMPAQDDLANEEVMSHATWMTFGRRGILARNRYGAPVCQLAEEPCDLSQRPFWCKRHSSRVGSQQSLQL